MTLRHLPTGPAERVRGRTQSGTWTAIVAGLTWGFTALAERRDRRI